MPDINEIYVKWRQAPIEDKWQYESKLLTLIVSQVRMLRYIYKVPQIWEDDIVSYTLEKAFLFTETLEYATFSQWLHEVIRRQCLQYLRTTQQEKKNFQTLLVSVENISNTSEIYDKTLTETGKHLLAEFEEKNRLYVESTGNFKSHRPGYVNEYQILCNKLKHQVEYGKENI